MSSERKWTYTLQDIATASGQGINTVRDHKQKGRLDPNDLRAVAAYIEGYRLIKQAEYRGVAGGRGMVSVDAWGEPIRSD